MQLNIPVDVADAIQATLCLRGFKVCARPIPHDLENVVPLSCVEPMGGSRSDVVLDRHAVRVYTWDYTEADAMRESALVAAALQALQGERVGMTQCYRVSITTLPYPARDTDHPNLARACFIAQVYLRANTIDS